MSIVDEVTFDPDYLRALLTEVRPDVTLEEFREYANMPEVFDLFFATLRDRGEASLYQDEFNPPIVCLTPLGAARAGVALSAGHPPVWIREDGEPPPFKVVREEGMVLFSDLETEDEEGAIEDFLEGRADPGQPEPVAVLTDIETLAQELLDRQLIDGRFHPRDYGRTRYAFALVALGDPWPVGLPARAGPDTPSAAERQEEYAVCPFCVTLADRRACPVCAGKSPRRPCTRCAGRAMGFIDLCPWCQRSGVDHLLPRADPPIARRRHQRGALRGGLTA